MSRRNFEEAEDACGVFDRVELLRRVLPQAVRRGDRPEGHAEISAYLRDDKEQSPRSVYNKFESVMAFLKLQGMTSRRDEHGTVRPLVSKNDWPRFTEEEPEIYEREEITKFLDACEPNERIPVPLRY